MKARYTVLAGAVLLLIALNTKLTAQQTTPASGAVQMVVTAEARHGATPAAVTRDDVMVYQGETRDRVTAWTPAKGDNAALELYVLLDDSAGESLATHFQELRQFINSQPASTKVGVAYMQNGTAQVAQKLTDDHEQAAKSLRLPLGSSGINASPYFALSDLIKRWPSSNARREVLMISDGIDRYYEGSDLQDPYVGSAIENAQKSGILVFAIYNPGAGHFGHSYWRSYWGQIYLSQVADQTGGESYYIGFNGPAVDFTPFLQSINQHLGNQYLLGFEPKSEKKSGMQPVKVATELSNTDLVSADRVYVPAGL